MSQDNRKEIAVKIMDRNFNIKCAVDEVSDLHEAVIYLNNKIQESIKSQKIYNNEVVSVDRLIITALNITSELLRQKKQSIQYTEDMREQIQELENKIDQVCS